MTDTVESHESVLAEMREVTIPAQCGDYIERGAFLAIADRLAAAHNEELRSAAAKVAGLEANLRKLSPLNYEERCRLRDAEARVRELEKQANCTRSSVDKFFDFLA